MKSIKNLNELDLIKLLIKMFFIVFCFGIPLFMIKSLFAFMEDDLSYLGYSSNEAASKTDIIIISIKGISMTIFYIGCYYLIKVLKFKNLNEVFSIQKIALLKKAGKLIISSAWVGSFTITLSWFQEGFKSIGNIKSNNEFIYFIYFSAIIGLFLFIFSKILKKAVEFKQENDLTI